MIVLFWWLTENECDTEASCRSHASSASGPRVAVSRADSGRNHADIRLPRGSELYRHCAQYTDYLSNLRQRLPAIDLCLQIQARQNYCLARHAHRTRKV